MAPPRNGESGEIEYEIGERNEIARNDELTTRRSNLG